MDLLNTLRQDYARFPADQTYSLYAEDVYFRDPLNSFRGRTNYQNMINWMETWFVDIHMDLHEIQQQGDEVSTEWTLSWRAPLPWRPRLQVRGWTEMKLNAQGLIQSHVDYWYCSRWELVQQLFQTSPASNS
ncbi:MAG: DUF2358 domain-containing protein [Synechococcaceae cyanobacterium SM2_3_1]|nr:DUF2358 domain-containing protein [Synechococcaceae cyanobacterium SM2_3_1]